MLAVVKVTDGAITLQARQPGTGILTVTASDGNSSAKVQVPVAVMKAAGEAYIEGGSTVNDKLVVHLDIAQSEEVALAVSAPSGAKVYAGTQEASVFTPIEIATASFAPGQYVLRATYGGKTHNLRFVKR